MHKRLPRAGSRSIAIPSVLVTVLACITLLLQPVEASAQDEWVLQVQAGFDGYYRANTWMPVHAIAANEGPDIDGEIQVSLDIGGETITYRQPAVLPTHSRKRFTFYIPAQYGTRDVKVRLTGGERLLAEETARVQPIGDKDLFYGILSDDRSALNYLAALPASGTRRVHIVHLDLHDLPDQGRALVGIDMLVLHSLDTLALDEAQRNALRGWMAIGGHLVICGGPNAQATAAGLEDLLPVSIGGSETTTDVSGLGEYAGAPFLAQVPAVVAQVTAHADAQILAGAPERPLIVRRAFGGGRVDYLALDPDLEPMRTWIGSEDLWLKLTSRSALVERIGQESGWQNLYGALSILSDVALPSVLLVGGFLVLYVGVVGPLNFLLLKWLDRRAMAWVTVPVLILLFSCAAYVIGFLSRGNKVIVSEISVVRAQPGSQIALVDSYVGLYSPARRAYDVQVPDGSLVTTQSYPGYAAAGISQHDLLVEQGAHTLLRDLEMDVAEMRVFALQSVQPWARIESALIVTPGKGQYHIAGTITNLTTSAMEDCALIFESQAVRIPDIGKGETVPIALDVQAGYSVPPYQLVEDLAGDLSLNSRDRREQERRRQVLYGTFLYGNTRFGSVPQQLGTMTLIGWLTDSLQQIDVSDTSTATHATTLLLAPMAFEPGDGNMVMLPLRSIEWLHAGSGHAVSPYELYQDTGDEVFVFLLPSEAQDLAIEQFHLYVVNTVPDPVYYTVPEIEIQDVTTGDWEQLSSLQWGANAIRDPERFVNDQGQIAVRIDTRTIEGMVSVDFALILSK